QATLLVDGARCALTCTADSRPTRAPSTSSVAWGGPDARTRVMMPLDGTPAPPTAQPSVSRISRRVASRAGAEMASAVTAQENSLRTRVYEVIAMPPLVVRASPDCFQSTADGDDLPGDEARA